MNSVPFSALSCPLDGATLYEDGKSWRCHNGHSFDVAREGYVHLLPVQKKRSRDPGDSRDMVAARRRFLGAGHYAPIVDAISRIVLADGSDTLSCLDAGCGEGHYLRHLALEARSADIFSHGVRTDNPRPQDAQLIDSQVLGAPNDEKQLALLGLDISKWAVISAAKALPEARWIVGSNANIPVTSASLDRVLCLFGFPVFPEFARVLKPAGLLVMADAGTDHLRELRERIYPSLKPPRIPAPLPASFTQIHSLPVRFTLELLSAEAIHDLLTMTPHLYRATIEKREEVLQLQQLTVTVDVLVKVLQRVEIDDGIDNGIDIPSDAPDGDSRA